MAHRDAQRSRRIPRRGRLGGWLGWGDIHRDGKSGIDWPEEKMVRQCGTWRRRGYRFGTHDRCDPVDDCCARNPGVALISVAATDSAASESGDTGTFTITRIGGAGALTVSFALSGSATVNTDYTASAASSITFASGETTKTVTITPIADALSEAAETVVLSILPPPYVSSTTNYSVDPDAQNATVTIANV